MTTSDLPRAAFAPSVSVSGLGLRLRDWTDEDLPAMAALFDEPQVDRWTPLRSPFTLETARAYLTRAREGRAAGLRLQLAVTEDGGTPLGEVLLFRASPDERDAELGYAIGAAHRRRGLATRAVRLMTGYAYGTLAVDRVLLRIAPDNEASAAVARSAGFRLTDDEPVVRDRGDGTVSLLTWRHDRGSA
ncbi:GNAT family N-acetyltransferase [Planomonospora sp. ID82291]|uniref:GNAT family N-acetyltransferase n=1 Tax=Planomonospora sp. ID82291 TaxID=2738136 RepID=UPI0018C38C03|nr:GNAT family N-acetyltransferase [Planomonospora sp. ID82291]MBG0814855.1 GNAT family N-acetyltransferase [Planomonospora sp. ID82291]